MARSDVAAVAHLFDGVPELEADAIMFYIFRWKSYAEVGKKIGLSKGGAKKAVERAAQKGKYEQLAGLLEARKETGPVLPPADDFPFSTMPTIQLDEPL